MVMLQMNAARALVKPLVFKNVCMDSRNGGSFSPLILFSSSDADGGIGGSPWNCKRVPAVMSEVMTAINPK